MKHKSCTLNYLFGTWKLWSWFESVDSESLTKGQGFTVYMYIYMRVCQSVWECWLISCTRYSFVSKTCPWQIGFSFVIVIQRKVSKTVKEEKKTMSHLCVKFTFCDDSYQTLSNIHRLVWPRDPRRQLR